ncbi:MAG: putative toxin-antitoxin system toxin component, PIN family [Oleiphilus sp.]
MARFTVILDACVLYPAPLRDLLMRLALTDLFKARWTDQIHEEWINALLRVGNKFSREKLETIRDLMDENVRDAKVADYESLIDNLNLPDQNDRHVLATAIRCNADAIVTANVKDFPKEELEKYSIEVIHPDDFICYQIELDAGLVCNTVKRQRKALNNPPKSVEEILVHLQKCQLPQTVSALRKYQELL